MTAYRSVWPIMLGVGAALALLVSLAGAVLYAVRRPQPVAEAVLALTPDSQDDPIA